MSKEWKCKECVLNGTDACKYPYRTDDSNVCKASIIDSDYAYEQGRADMQEFVEKRCEKLGIDYISIFTCNSAD